MVNALLNFKPFYKITLAIIAVIIIIVAGVLLVVVFQPQAYIPEGVSDLESIGVSPVAPLPLPGSSVIKPTPDPVDIKEKFQRLLNESQP